MMKAEEYLPVGTVISLRDAIRKIMIIGIMQEQRKEEQTVFYDYAGVIFPEGLITAKSIILFNHKDINDVVFRGYENPERQDFIVRLGKELQNTGNDQDNE